MSYIDIAQDHVAELYPLIIYGKPALHDIVPGSIIGTWAISTPGKQRFILDKSIEVAPGVMPADVARAWVRTQYELPFKRRKSQLVRSHKVPLHARIGSHGECCYVDIKAAYLRVLSLGYDVEYVPGRYIGSEPVCVPREIATNKYSYSIAVAMSGSILSDLEMMGKNGIFHHRPMNMFSNPSLFNMAQDTLNAIGGEMLSVLGEHCVYANTDGFIVHSGFERYALDIINSWGFDARIKHQGNTAVRGVGSWKIGDEQTMRFDAYATDFTSNLMDRDSRRWLKTRWLRWAGKVDSINNL